MQGTISQSAGNHAIQFGYVGQIESLSVDNRSQQATGNGILQVQIGSITGSTVNVSHGEQQQSPQLRSLPVLLVPRSFPLLLGRREEVKVAVNALPYDQPVEFYGSPGIGKTALLRHLAHHPSITPAFSDGIVYHHSTRHQPVSDLLQILFNAFHESSVPFKSTDIQIRHAFQEKRILIILEVAKLNGEELENLLNSLPSCTFLVTSQERQLWGEGHSVGLHGLHLNDAVSLVARELGRTLSPEERLVAEKLCTALQGHPLRILQTVALVREDNISLALMQERIQSTTSTLGWVEQLLASLQKPQKLIVTALAALGGVALGVELLENLTEIPQVKLVLETLTRRNLLQVDGSRYSLSNNLIEYIQQHWNLTPFLEKATTYFTTWIQQQTTPQSLLEECDAILQVLEWAVKVGRWSDVICLGRGIEGTLALSGQWGTWQIVLQHLLQAARVLGDPAVEAFALHQLGTRSLCLSEVTQARDYLTQALRIRESLNDQIGAEVTRHNLEFLLEPPLPPQTKPQSESAVSPPRTRDPLLFKGSLAVLLLTLGGLLFLILWFLYSKPQAQDYSTTQIPIPSKTPVPTETPIQTTPPTTTPVPTETPIQTTPPTETPVPTPTHSPTITQPETPTLQSLSLNQSSVIGGATVEGRVILSHPAPESGVIVNLNSRNSSLARVAPSSLKVEAGNKEASFEIFTSSDGNNSLNAGIVEITATYAGVTRITSLMIESEKLPKPEISSIRLEQGRIPWGKKVKGAVTLKSTAPDDGVIIIFTSDEPSLATILPSSLKIEAGNTTAPFEVLTSMNDRNFLKDKIVEIAASLEGGESRQTEKLSIYTENISPRLQSLHVENGNGVKIESLTWSRRITTVQGKLTLNQPDPNRDIAIALTGRNVKVQETVTVKAGETTAIFPIRILGFDENQQPINFVEIKASYKKMTVTATLKVVKIVPKIPLIKVPLRSP
ncbi:hypothetical protein WA1_46135 [Scytonema hofmannii PCC 7110]|uniref:AAA+ ATPase domain-containing protein n=1 Tax=Scytonema hofmannii PCC 7110 TaxID=128403 RepID=A0A139WX63_9CYAN|nr:ATP-binding protein [Scytonema hofmannii]KYC37028.1 hypothetical protein WA1_46135 [Scytonema hofmannii PCC 7110]